MIVSHAQIVENQNIATATLLLLNSVGNGGISQSSDFASRNKDTYLTFILNCRSDYLVAYPQKEQQKCQQNNIII
tara:strand:- start:102 stop:326 length:225 start_codon:yes stop_codon:yes gene_type:complete